MSSLRRLFKSLLAVSLLVLYAGCDSEKSPSFIVLENHPPFPPTPLQKDEDKLVETQKNKQEDQLPASEETPAPDDEVRVAGNILQAYYNETQYMPTREDRIVILMTKMKIDQKAEKILDIMMLD